MRSTDGKELDQLLGEQLAYYRALAAEYLNQGLDLPGGDELTEALDAFQPKGCVLELACGPGVWTGKLLRYAADVTDHPPADSDGSAYRLIKMPHQPEDLETQLRELGWDIKVTATAGPIYWGTGKPR